MLVRLNVYKFWLRNALYAVPLLSFLLTGYLRSVGAITGRRVFAPFEYIYLLLFLTVIWSVVIEHYEISSVSKLFQENTGIFRAAVATTVAYVISVTALFLSGQFRASRVFVGVSAIASVSFTVVILHVFRALIAVNKDRRRPHRVLVVGTDSFARKAAWHLTHGPFGSARIVGYVRLTGQNVEVGSARVYELEDVVNLPQHEFDDVVVAIPPAQFPALRQVMGVMEILCVPIRVVVDLDGLIIKNKVFQFGQLQMINVTTTPAESLTYLFLKRAFDLAFSLAAIILTAPLMAAIAIGIRLGSPGPILFVQDRVGLNGKVFRMLKFRTMKISDSAVSDVVWTTENDPRCTRFGTFLRKTSLDELPQFVNVLRGDMSVVGPRPERPYFVKKFQEDYFQYNRRHHLKVGITGWAQVNGLRGDTCIRKRVDYDLYYLQNWSFWLDLRIVFMTFLSGLKNKNAY